MKNKDIHNDLPEPYLRDFLAKQLKRNECYMTLEDAERKLKEAQEIFEKAKNREGIKTILKLKGWDYIDCSDEIKDYDSKTYFHFIGTMEEFIEAMPMAGVT